MNDEQQKLNKIANFIRKNKPCEKANRAAMIFRVPPSQIQKLMTKYGIDPNPSVPFTVKEAELLNREIEKIKINKKNELKQLRGRKTACPYCGQEVVFGTKCKTCKQQFRNAVAKKGD